MATTKKVARTSQVKAQGRVSATVPKARKTPAKKVTVKTSVKKTSHKTSVKRSTSNTKKSPAPQKKDSAFDAKLKKIEALHAKAKKSTESEIPVSVIAQKLEKTKPTVALALLSPYRFPLDIDKLAVNTARFGGVFFVIIGAIFTVLLADSALSPSGQTAATALGVSRIGAEATTVTNAVDPKPEAEFRLSDPEGVNGTAEVVIKVPYATSVTLMAYYKTKRDDVTLGRLEKISEDTWRIAVDTSKYEDGEYKLKALITNAYGSYEEVHDTYIVLANNSSQQNTDQTTSASSPKNEETTRTNVSEQTAARQPRVTSVVDDALTQAPSRTVAVTEPVSASPTRATEPPTSAPSLTPEIRVSLEKTSPLSGIVPVTIGVENAVAVEVYALPKNALIQRYLGTAKKSTASTWDFRWDTATTPNGEYSVVAYVRNAYGMYTKETASFTVFNELKVEHTEAAKSTIEKLSAVAQEETKRDVPIQSAAQASPSLSALPPVTASSTPATVPTEASTSSASLVVDVPDGTSVQETDRVSIELQEEVRTSLRNELDLLSSALRVKNENAVFEIKERLNSRKEEIVKANADSGEDSQFAAQLQVYMEESIRAVEAEVTRMEKVISERTALNAATDSDKDGITDYDEVALYETDPFVADSDGDGFVDGAEILNGYNPTDALSEVLIAYESPKESGIVREDVFVVESITPAAANEDTPETKPAAILSGKGLPNSFVTLYIFSTPVVVTLKTDPDGNWTYRFEKELEDGEHQVYVGITDNAGKLVAKSNPFTFVKEAQAFSAVNNAAQTPSVPDENPSFISQYMLYMVLSVSVVAIGLVLILLGLHLDTRQRKFDIASEAPEAV